MLRYQFRLLLLQAFFLLTGFQVQTQPDQKLVRKQLLLSVDSKHITDSLYTKLTGIKNKSAVITGYIGALQALKAKHSWNPYNKLKFLNQAETSFSTAVNHDPDNIEIRFMRFSVEYNVPAFLGYTKNLTADRLALVKQFEHHNYNLSDKDLLQTVIKFLIDSGKCTASETELLHKQLIALK